MTFSPEWLGLLAAACTSIAFIPQAIKTIRTQHTEDISLVMYSLFTFGVACWLAYGLWITNWPVIIGNAITIVAATIILGLKIKNG